MENCKKTKRSDEKMTRKEIIRAVCKVALVLGVLLLSRAYFNAKFHPAQLEQDLLNTDEEFYQAIAEIIPAAEMPELPEIPMARDAADPAVAVFPKAEKPEKPMSDYDARLYQATERLCTLRDEYNDQFRALEVNAEQVLGTVPEEDQGTARQHVIGLYYMSMGTNLERDYLLYGQQIQVTLEQLFLENDEDPVLADALFQAYREDLSTRKLYYMSQINRTYFEYEMETPF